MITTKQQSRTPMSLLHMRTVASHLQLQHTDTTAIKVACLSCPCTPGRPTIRDPAWSRLIGSRCRSRIRKAPSDYVDTQESKSINYGTSN